MSNDLNERISKLETGLEFLIQGQTRMENAIAKLADAVREQSTLREGHARHSEEIALLRKNMHDVRDILSAVPYTKEKVDRQEKRLDILEPKIEEVQKGLAESSAVGGITNKWFFWAVFTFLMLLTNTITYLILH